jgi:hypothetical protein
MAAPRLLSPSRVGTVAHAGGNAYAHGDSIASDGDAYNYDDAHGRADGDPEADPGNGCAGRNWLSGTGKRILKEKIAG